MKIKGKRFAGSGVAVCKRELWSYHSYELKANQNKRSHNILLTNNMAESIAILKALEGVEALGFRTAED